MRAQARKWASRALLASALGICEAAGGAPVDSCVDCHAALTGDLEAPVGGMKEDVHARHGLSCADCHGGDPTEMDLAAMAPERGYVGKPARSEIPDFCARCHSDPEYMRRFNPGLPTNQRERYWTSVHGKRLRRGDTKVATCVDCHGVHGILEGKRADSPVHPTNVPATCGRCHSDAGYMREYDIPTDQEAAYRRSVHGELLFEKRDLSAPACNTCHDNHGASPPGVTSIAEVCGLCHANNASLFVSSPHKRAFDDLGLPECVTCHGNHEIHRASDTMLGAGAGSLCPQCHAPDSPGYRAAAEMRDAIEELKAALRATEARLEEAERAGMEMGDARYEFHSAETALIRARTEVHRFSPQALHEAIQPGLQVAQRTQKLADAALEEAWARRRNLLFPITVIVALMVLLRLKLRELERPSAAPPRDSRREGRDSAEPSGPPERAGQDPP